MNKRRITTMATARTIRFLKEQGLSFSQISTLLGYSKQYCSQLIKSPVEQKEEQKERMLTVSRLLQGESLPIEVVSSNLKISDDLSRKLLSAVNLSFGKKTVSREPSFSHTVRSFYKNIHAIQTNVDQLLVLGETLFQFDLLKSDIRAVSRNDTKDVPSSLNKGFDVIIPCLAAISVHKTEFCETLSSRGSYDAKTFTDAFKRILECTTPYPGPRSIVIVDRAPLHAKAWNKIEDLCKAKGVILRLTPKGGHVTSPTALLNREVEAKLRNLLTAAGNELNHSLAIIGAYTTSGPFSSYFEQCMLDISVNGDL